MTRPKPKKIENLLNLARECISSGRYRDTTHSLQRRQQRKIILPEIIHVLKTGRHEKAKDHFEEAFNCWNYSIRGKTLEDLDLRVIVSFDKERELLVITAFYIEGR